MIYNFLDPKLKPNVKCSSPCTEGYDATNLISDDTDLKSKGFLAYSPIKPPVDVEFEFICSIDLYNVIIWPTVGVQKSIGFEVLVSSGYGNYEIFCNGVIRNKEPGLVFYNGRKYHQRAVNNILENVRNFSHYAFKSGQWRIFTSCTKIKVRILRTDNSVPCIGKIEAWGVVARACSEKTKESINRMYNRDSVSTDNSEVAQNAPTVASQCMRETRTVENSFQIPEEFLDPITLEAMILPVTLPSGKTIDQCTLEKHNRYQDTWLRRPFDPFTGIPFTENRKPVFNSALKNRIDHFLFLHQDRPEVKKCSRTVGSSVPFQIPDFYKKRSSTSSTSDLHKETYSINSEESDLNNALTSTLSKIKRYSTASVNGPRDSNKILTCSACKKIDSLYKLSCNHFLCRNCLVKLESSEGENACNVCFCLFKKSEVIKVHSNCER